jgi:HJR/Mrr/RecB family endonuclease
MSDPSVTVLAVTNTQRLPREPNPGESQDHQHHAENETRKETVPLLPAWIRAGGWIPLAITGFFLLVLCVHTGTSYGDTDGWSLVLALVVPSAAWLWNSFTRRTEELELRRRLELRSRIKISEIDHLSWQEFERQCIILLTLLGYENVKKTSDRPKVKAVDITATNPRTGKREVFECKHRRLKPVGVSEVNELIGRISSGLYRGLPVTLMTNARVTDGARDKATQHSINVIHREQLAELMAQASDEPGNRTAPGRRVSAPHVQDTAAEIPAGAGGLLITWFSTLRPAAKLATAATGASGLAILVIVVQMTVTGPRPAAVPPAAGGPHSAVVSGDRAAEPATTGNQETPQDVTRKFFTAISHHDWPEVWQLGGKNTGHGPYATYTGMISGYRDTVRDVPVSMAAAGNTVSGRFLAYETRNRVQTYTFTYVIRNGTIVNASQQVIATTS